jgi:phenylalanine-4-hydroxylase
MAVYHAIRTLSDVKEDPGSTPDDVARAQAELDRALAAVDHVSEASLLSRMNWWTVEYGLVGSLDDPKIYGAGLLSSVGESYHCLGRDVRKLPFSLSCTEVTYDITRPQPQLFVTPDFQALERELERFAATMAFRTGGAAGLSKARQARYTATVELDSGAQISGVLADFRADARGEPTFLRFSGPVALAQAGRELAGHDPSYHREGFSSPVGPLRGQARGADTLTDPELSRGRIEFASGVALEGRFTRSLRAPDGRALLATFEDCTVRHGDEVLFRPEWGTFDLACGTRVTSVFGGAADRPAWLRTQGAEPSRRVKPKSNLTPANRRLNELYAQVRAIREQNRAREAGPELGRIHAELEREFAGDWLLRLELLELAHAAGQHPEWEASARGALGRISRADPASGEMIRRGLELLR